MHTIGTVGEVLADLNDEPRYVNVNMGLFGLRSVLIPVQLAGGHAPARAHAPLKVLLKQAMNFTGHRPPGRSTTCANALRERTRRRDTD